MKKPLKILLIDPPFYRILGFYNRYFPFGLVALATFLKQNGFTDIQVYDADFNEQPESIDYSRIPDKYPTYLDSFKENGHLVWAEVEETIERLGPDIVGISIWTTFAAASFFTAKIAKKIKPECLVVMGGPHATAKADEILRICPDVDYVISGEGEDALLELALALDNEAADVASIAGLSYRKGKQIIHNTPRSLTIDLNKFPFPDRTLLMNEERYNSEDMGLIMSGRGCPYSCTYCATDTRRVGFRSPGHILSEIRFVKNRYNTTQFTFKDDSFTVNRKRVEEFCNKLIQERLRITWECNTKVSLINEPLLQLMKKAGCNFIKIGVESGSERVLKMMNKGITHEQVRKAAKLFRKVGTHWTGYFMMGVPGETEEDIKKTMEFLSEIRPDFACIGVYEPFPGTVMFQEGVKRGLLKQELTLNDFYDTSPNNYYKMDGDRQTDTITPERFARLVKESMDFAHSYNRAFIHVLKMARARLNNYLNDPKILWDDFKKYLSY